MFKLQSSIFNSPIKRDLRFAATGLSGLGIQLVQDSLILMVEFSFLDFKSEAIFGPHRQTDIIDRQAFTFEIHGTTSIGEMLVPGNVIMDAFMTSSGHGI
jgi:hypothetical protein